MPQQHPRAGAGGGIRKKSGGSALKGLKAALKAAGKLGHSAASAGAARKAARRPAAHAGKAQRTSTAVLPPNPFELQFSRPKHDVLGRKVKGAVGKPLAQRKRAEEIRQQTLAEELRTKDHESAFVDRRFGENNPTMSLEDKMMQRFMRERMKSSKRNSSIFNLEEEELTHHGRSLSALDDSGDAGLDLIDSDDDGEIDKDTVAHSHFGGFEDVPKGDHKKSRHEVMQEVIAKSKFHKLERQKQNEEVLKLAKEVDADLDSIRDLLRSSAGSQDEPPTENAPPPQSTDRAPRPSQMEDYDRFLNDLRGEAKSAPSDRLKTEEELASEERAKLEKLEEERRRRMLGLSNNNLDSTKPERRAPQADDLGDDFADDADDGSDGDLGLSGANAQPLTYRDGVLVNNSIFMKPKRRQNDDAFEFDANESGSDDAEDDEDDGDSDDDDDDDDDEGDLDNDDDNEHDVDLDVDDSDNEVAENLDGGEHENDSQLSFSGEDLLDTPDIVKVNGHDESAESETENSILPKAGEGSTIPDDGDISIPYTFPAPQTYAEFVAMVAPFGPSQQATVVHRIRVLYHVKLGGDNRAKLERLLAILFEHCDRLAREPSPSGLETVDALFRHIHELCVQFPQVAAEICVARLKKMHRRLVGTERSPEALPYLADLLLLRIIGRIFSVSDLQHPVGTPAALVMSEFFYSLDRKWNDPNRERANAQKLRSQFTKERKGALRELRKDGKFVARERLHERQRKADEYQKRLNQIMGQLANQEGAVRNYEREMGRRPRR
ncbi:nucleolar complex protein 14 [Cladochytrium tenue]|nr:nucleolar complex protein 14 [Cladochytrium tenue]